MDTAKWSQVIERKPIIRPQKDCPRCNSPNTKFCYYNNYSLSQPRHFCKTCRRYWTEGGTLRNIPVGGSSRKTKKSSSTSSSKKLPADLSLYQPSDQNPKTYEGQNLNLAYPSTNRVPGFVALPYRDDCKTLNSPYPNISSLSSYNPVMEFLSSSELISSHLMSIPVSGSGSNTMYPSSEFPLHGLRLPSLNLSSDGLENGYGNMGGSFQNTNPKFPFLIGGSKSEFEQDRGLGESINGPYWNKMLAGGSW
ncbi:unnamed protein product [Fraxinus pennsylvanica]|uniref:Dof zinc finger protein n=1 Tax=Fraxinus pennsylvanica TaxID=56036 RepID=A0AAD1ZR85_9LAMI|nr:unnamed protein product [Fraxinus pennsylvanica]